MITHLYEASVAGVDGCKSGWVMVSQTPNGKPVIKVVPQFATVLEQGHEVIVVDIPIGLLDKGTRLADSAARQTLKGRSCCVFTAPLPTDKIFDMEPPFFSAVVLKLLSLTRTD